MKKILSIVMAVFIAAAFFIGSTNADINKISRDIDVNSKIPVDVIVELQDTPVAIYKKSLKYKILSIINKKADVSYSNRLLKKQEKLMRQVKELGGETHFTYTYVFSGFSCKLSGDAIKTFAKLRNVKKIYPDKKAYLLREKADQIIGADRVHKLKDINGNYISGKGIVIGIVDTGIDYNDTELGGGGFPNSKVIGGYDFADGYADPMDTDGHGTHVAGIIAGTKYGVAPGAKIYAYKVFSGTNETTSTSVIVKGIEQATKDKCNVINISIGTVSGKGDGSDPESIAVENAVKDGITVVAAAGNTGGRSEVLPFPFSAPASNKDVIGVGASDDSEHGIITIDNKDISGLYPSESPSFTDGKYKIVYCGYGRKEDFTNKNIEGKIAFVKRGDVYFGDKDLNAKNAGAIGVICFNSGVGLPNIKLQSEGNPNAKDFIPFFFITNTDGRFIEKSLAATDEIYISNKTGLGKMATFSSNGPTADFHFKPDLVAPGVNISSTVLHNNIEKWSGTSMAAPFITGSVALLKQAKPHLTPKDIKAVLMNTSDILTNPDSGRPFSPLMQGAGRVNIYNAIKSDVVITPPSVIFGSGENSVSETFTVKNLSSNVLILSLSEKTFSNNTISVKIPNSIVIPSSGSTTFSANFNANNVKNGNIFGAIYLSGSNTPLHIPFIYIPEFGIPQPLENISLTQKTITPGKNGNLNFTVGVGAENSEDKGVPYTENIADEVKVNIYNSSGRLVETIFEKSPISIGQYSVKIQTTDNFGNYILNNGQYFYKVMYVEPNENQDTEKYFPSIVKTEKTGSFTVQNMPQGNISLTPEKNETLLLKTEEDFWVDVKLSLISPIINLKTSVMYDPTSLKLLGVEKLPGINYTSFSYSSDSGIIYITASGNFKKTSPVLRIHFAAINKGSGIIAFTSASYYPISENVTLRPIPFRIGNYSRPFDINEDKTTDSKDYIIFQKSYGLNNKDAGFNIKCDFNKDGIIDSNDFFMLSRHFGEIYP